MAVLKRFADKLLMLRLPLEDFAKKMAMVDVGTVIPNAKLDGYEHVFAPVVNNDGIVVDGTFH